MGQCMKAACMRWLRPEVLTKEQIVEVVVGEHYMAILLFKPKNWVLCHQPRTLEEAITLMEVYASADAADYRRVKATGSLMSKWKEERPLARLGRQSRWPL